MTYNNTKPVSGFSIVSQRGKDVSQQQQQQQQQQQDGIQRLAKCVTKAYDTNEVMTSTCYTAAVAQLHRNQLVYIYNDVKYHRPIITSRQSSFWAIYKIN